MREKDLKEDLATMAYKAESDHEVQMARSDLYKIAKYSIKLHEMLKAVNEQQGIEGWVQSKITKAADYMGSVYHHLDYEMKFDEMTVTFQFIIPRKPIIIRTEKKQLLIGIIIQIKFLKT